jgi:hypothetical protein
LRKIAKLFSETQKAAKQIIALLMKKFALLSSGIMSFALLSAHAQTITLFTTTNDFSQWSGNGGSTVSADSSWSVDTSTINGVGNTTAPGGSGTSGSMLITWASSVGSFNEIAVAPSGSLAFVQALDPGASQLANGEFVTVAYSGTIYMDYSVPDNEGGSYFQLGVMLQYPGNGYYGPVLSSSSTDLGFKDNNGQEVYQATIPYTIVAGTGYGFGFGVFYNSNYSPLNSFHIDDISVVAPVAPPTPPPVAPLFTTFNDFEPFTSSGGDLVEADSTWSVSNNITNGLGNTITPGGTGTAGSLLLDWSSPESGYGDIATGPNEQANGEFMQAIDPGCDTNSAVSVAAYGNIYMDFSQPDNSGGGTYFQVGIGFNYAANGYNNYEPFFPSSTTDLHFTDNSGYEVYQATIPYTINAGNYYGFTPYVAVNSDYQSTNGFHVGYVSVSAAQLPLITSVSLRGTNLVIQGTNALGGEQFTLLTTTNILVPLSQWTTVGSGTFSGPMTFSNTFPINPANPQSFYSIKVP